MKGDDFNKNLSRTMRRECKFTFYFVDFAKKNVKIPMH